MKNAALYLAASMAPGAVAAEKNLKIEGLDPQGPVV